MSCPGTFSVPVRVHPVTGAGECAICGVRFDRIELTRNKGSSLRFYMIPRHDRGRGTWSGNTLETGPL